MTTGPALLLFGLALSLLVIFGLALTLVLRRTGGRPGAWRLRCLSCDRSATLESVGGSRTGAWSWGARRIVRCSQCRGFRLAALEAINTETSAEDTRNAA